MFDSKKKKKREEKLLTFTWADCSGYVFVVCLNIDGRRQTKVSKTKTKSLFDRAKPNATL